MAPYTYTGDIRLLQALWVFQYRDNIDVDSGDVLHLEKF